MGNSQSAPQRAAPFGRRRDVHRIIFAKGDEVTSFTIHPAIALGGVIIAVLFAVGYLAATSYLMFRDDLLAASHIRQISIQNAYEDQLASLRIEIDRIASRQMLDQKSVENKIDRLLGLRASLEERGRAVSQLAETASAAGIALPEAAPAPKPRPSALDHAALGIDPIVTGSLAVTPPLNSGPNFAASFSSAMPDGLESGISAFSLIDSNNVGDHIRTANNDVVDLNIIEQNLLEEERAQTLTLRLMAKETVDSSRDIAAVIRSLGYKAPAGPPHSADAIGGPFHDVTKVDSITFDTSVLALEENLEHLNGLKKTVQQFPLNRPLRTGTITSQFGRRLDPFLNQYAMHAGMDFKAPVGTPIYAAGPGKVIHAGWSGGYGQLVEVQHVGGITTRYGHMSRISVKEGDSVDTSTILGQVGTTGRSTGPHLHYETRLDDTAVNPGRFIRAGIKLNSLL